MLERYKLEIADSRNEDPQPHSIETSLSRTPSDMAELLKVYEQNLKEEGVVEVPYGPQHFQYILEVVNHSEKPPIVLFKGNSEMKDRFTSNFNEFDQNKDFSDYAEQRKHSKIGNHIGIEVFTFSKKVTLKDIQKPPKRNEFTALTLIPWSALGQKPSPFDSKIFDPSKNILSKEDNFGRFLGITEATTEVSSEGTKLAMHLEEHNAQTVNYNHGPGLKEWIVIENNLTLKAAKILGKNEFKNFYGACCLTFCHRDVAFNLEKENIPFLRIVQHPGDTVFLPPGVLHMVTNISANMSESVNIIMRKDLPICRSYKVCYKHAGSVQISGMQEMESLFEKYKENKIENFIYFADEDRNRKLKALDQLKNCDDPAKQAILKALEQSFRISHETPELLKAYEDGNFAFQVQRESVDTAITPEIEKGLYPNISKYFETEQEIDQPSKELQTISAKASIYPDISHEIETGEEIRQQTSDSEESIDLDLSHCSSDSYTLPTLEPNARRMKSTFIAEQPEYSEPAEEFVGNIRREGLEEEYRQIVDGQNILKSNITFKFKCLCQCQPPIISESFHKCSKHLKTHEMTIVVPTEKCTLCNAENKAVFQKVHICKVKPYKRKNMQWRRYGNV